MPLNEEGIKIMHLTDVRRQTEGNGQSHRLASTRRQHPIHRLHSPAALKGALPPRKARPSQPQTSTSHQDLWLDGPFNPVKGEQALWRAVISQTLMDARNRSAKPEMLSHRIKAVQWLTGMSDDFRRVCEYAGLNPVFVRQKARAMLRADPYMEDRIERATRPSVNTETSHKN